MSRFALRTKGRDGMFHGISSGVSCSCRVSSMSRPHGQRRGCPVRPVDAVRTGHPAVDHALYDDCGWPCGIGPASPQSLCPLRPLRIEFVVLVHLFSGSRRHIIAERMRRAISIARIGSVRNSGRVTMPKTPRPCSFPFSEMTAKQTCSTAFTL